MKKVLVTGAKGFIGLHCLGPLAKRGFEIHAVSSRTVHGAHGAHEAPDIPEGITWHQADLLDVNCLGPLLDKIKPTHLLHLAWVTEHGTYWTSASNLDWVGASLALVKAFWERGGLRAVAAGTCAEYDWHSGTCVEDSTPFAPATLYGTCKRALGSTLEEYARQKSLGFAWGRIFFAYGPFEKQQRMVPSIITSLLDNKEAVCRNGSAVRDFLHVSDVSRAFALLLDTQVDGSYNICSGVETSLGDVTRKIAKAMGREDLCRIEMTGAGNSADEAIAVVGDMKKIHEATGFASQYSIDSGLADTIAWWKKNLHRK